MAWHAAAPYRRPARLAPPAAGSSGAATVAPSPAWPLPGPGPTC